MSINCKICNVEFEKIIPWQHLKTHSISTEEYKLEYGPVYSNETLKKLSDRIPHNKGKKLTDLDSLENIRRAIVKREERFQNGEFKRGSPRTLEEKKILSTKTKEYAKNHPKEMKSRAQRAIDTKIKNGYDFGSNMRGKKHSEESKQKMLTASILSASRKSEKSHSQINDLIKEYNLTVHTSLFEKSLELSCNICATRFVFGKQYFMGIKTFPEICPTCFPRNISKSKGEIELFDFIKEMCSDAVSGYRGHYHDKEIDIYIPSKNIGFEFNGLYWHSEIVLTSNGKMATSDREKQLEFAEKGIRLIEIFEDELYHKKDIVKSRIRNILGFTDRKIYARKCEIKEVDSKISGIFFNTNHIMGNGRSNIRLGLYHNDELISLMSFVHSNLSRKSKDWEINRFASSLNTSVTGGANRLFKAFIKQINPEKVISYADNRWSDGNLYERLGFDKTNNGIPNYWYVLPNNCNRIHRFSLRKNKEDDPLLTEYENRLKQGYLRIWDCGSSKWVWSRKSPDYSGLLVLQSGCDGAGVLDP